MSPQRRVLLASATIVFLVGAGLSVHLLRATNSLSPTVWLLALLTTGIYIGLVSMLDYLEPEPWKLRAFAFGWGLVVAAPFSMLIMDRVQLLVDERQVRVLYAPIIEECIKGLGLVAVLMWARDEIDGMLDGMVLGAMIGLGFSCFEDPIYYTASWEAGGASALLNSFLGRGVENGLCSHAAYTAIFGAGLGWAATRTGARNDALAIGSGLILAIGAHAVWNDNWRLFLSENITQFEAFALQIPLAILVLHGPFLVLLAIVAVKSHQRALECVKKQLADLLAAPGLERLLQASSFQARIRGGWGSHSQRQRIHLVELALDRRRATRMKRAPVELTDAQLQAVAFFTGDPVGPGTPGS